MYEPRVYRSLTSAKDLVGFKVIEEESDLFILADSDLSSESKELLLKYRTQIKNYIKKNPQFQTSLEPYYVVAEQSSAKIPDIIKKMADVSAKAGVGPMAAVAGAISEFVGMGLLKLSPEGSVPLRAKNVIIENGGDIFIKTAVSRKIGIFAGKSKFSNKLAIEISPEKTPLGVCTSSGTVGHSLSFGKADAVCIVASSATLADACATSAGNIVKTEADVQKAINFAKEINGIIGAVVIIGDKIGIWGDIKIVQ